MNVKDLIAPCIDLCCYTTLWNITVSKKAINDKLQSSVATCLSCGGGVVNNQIMKGLLLSAWVNFFLNRWTFGKVTSKSVVVSRTWRAWPTHCEMTKECTIQSRCGGGAMSNIHLTANLTRNLPVKKINRIRFDRIMVVSLWPCFFGPSCMCVKRSM